jgi:predicted SPOUT superfamily RNA methylase MTH1
MSEPRRRERPIAIALPSSLLEEIPHLREKTARAGNIARSAAIFRVEEILIYRDVPSEKAWREGQLLHRLLTYHNTPQYLRKLVFKKTPDLEYTGILPPLRTPNHPQRVEPNVGQIREGVVTSSGSTSLVDAGYKQPVTILSRLQQGERLTIRITTVSPRLTGERIAFTGLAIYWGFRVTLGNFTLAQLVKNRRDNLTISTSREGNDVRQVLDQLKTDWQSQHNPALVLFGSPREGIPEILARDKVTVQDVTDYHLNTVPNQGVRTVRTEEAVLATLSIFNLLEKK